MWTRSKRALAAVVVIAAVGVLQVPRAAAVLEPSGHPIAAFDGDGAVQTNFDLVNTFAEVRGLGIQKVGVRAGQIVLAGGYQDGFNEHIAVLRLNTDGTQDMGFGGGGEVKTVIGANDFVNDVVIQPDDKIVVAGFSDSDYMVVRYLPDGAIDTTFGGGDGAVVTGVVPGEFDRGQGVTLQADGKILVAGYSEVVAGTSERDMTVMRLTTTGALDTSFSGDGFSSVSLTTQAEQLRDVFVQADGKILAVGQTRTGTGTCNTVAFPHFNSVVLRMNANGTPDTTFGGDGAVDTNLATVGNCPDDGFRSVTVGSDGKIVAAGYANTTTDSSTNAKNNISVARYNADGTFDTTFDTDGRLWTNIASTSGFLSDVADDVHVLADGRILVGASSDGGGPGPIAGSFISENNFAALRYNTNGTLDSTFSGDGIGIYDFSENDTFDAMVVDASGRPVLAGYSFVAGQFVDPLLAVARVATNGVLDATFNSAGNPPGTFFKNLQGGSVDLGAGVVRQGLVGNAGKLVVVGSTDVGSQTDVGLVRYTTTGALDNTFGGDGKATGDDGGRNDAPSAAAVQADDKVVVVGSSFGTSGAPRATVMRFNPDSGLDTSFDTDGIATLTVGTNANQWDAVTLAPDGDIWVGGTVSDAPANWDLFVARYNSNGSPDNAFNGNGRVRLSLGANVDVVQAIAVQPDGKVVVAGSTFVNSSAQQFAIVRFNANGTPDATFGGGDGIVITAIGAGAFPRNEITGIAIQADGRIVVGGNGNDGTSNPQSNNVIRLARYMSDGSLDTSFGTGGIVTTNLAVDRFDRVGGIALQRDEKIVVFGYSQQLFVTSDDFVIARYNWDNGSLDTTFGTTNSGATILAASLGQDQAAGGVLFPDGSSAIGGTVGSSDVGAARFAGDPAPIVPGVPDLAAASDSGQSSTDNVTNDATPTFTGASCNVGETTILKADGTVSTPLSRQLCRSAPWTVTQATTLSDGVRAIRAFSRNGAGDTTDTSALNVTIDTVANPPVITSPTQGQTITIPPSPSISGTVDETIAGAVIDVRENGSLVCSGVANAAGAWSCLTTLGPGLHTVTARQTDVAGNVSVDSPGRTFTLKVPTTTDVTTSVSPSRFGQAVTFTATVTAVLGTPDGTVQFVIDGGAPQSVTLTNGVGTLTVPSGGLSALTVGTHSVVGNYLGSVGYFASTDTLAPAQTVIKADTAVAVQVTPEPSVTGQAATMTATLTVVAPGAGTPTGDVSFAIDGGAPAQVTLSGGTATIPGVVLSVGTHTIDATYAGDTNFNGSTGQTTHVVEKGATSVGVTALPEPSPLGDNVTFTATVSALAPAVGTPGGTVDFVIDGAPGIPVPIAGGVATYTTSTLTGGPHTVQADYGGSGDFLASSGTLAGGHVVTKGTTTTVLEASVPSSTFGQLVTFTATITSAAPLAIPGDVAFIIDGGAPMTLPISGGKASFSTSALPVGPHTITANYLGDVNFETSTSSIPSFAVAKASTTTVLTASPNPSLFGEPVTLTATVTSSGGTPDGTVDFDLPGGPQTVALTNGIASLIVPSGVIATLPIGSTAITATYSGSASFESSSGTLGAQQVNQAATTTTVTPSSIGSVLGESVTFTITVAPVAPAGGTPPGSVAVSIDGGTASTLPLVNGAASFSTSLLGVGDHTVLAVYSGTADYAGSTGSVDHPVARAASQVTLTSSLNPSQPGQDVTFTATVTSGVGTPTGSVGFSIGGGPTVAVAASGGGVATLTISTLLAGARDVVATYSGDVDFAPSSDLLTQTVDQGATTTMVTVAPEPSVFGENVTVTVHVDPVAPATMGVTGTVDLDIDGIVTQLTLDGNQDATFTTSNLAVGAHDITATYLGDPNYTGSSSASTTHDVDQAPTTVAVSSAPNPSVFGQPVTFTATVTATGSPAVPEGSIAFDIGGQVRSATLSNGSASVTIADLDVGAHAGVVSYNGTASFAASDLDPIPTHVVDKAGSSMALSVDPPTPGSGEAFALTATVSALAPGVGTPTGSVTFTVDGATPVARTLVNGAATFSGLTLAGGSHMISVQYAGDAGFNSSTASFERTIPAGASTVTVTASPSTVDFGAPVTFTATVSAVAPASGDPKGTVEFVIDGNAPILAELHSPASITLSSLSAGAHTVVVNYLGSGLFAPSTVQLAGGVTVLPGEVTLSLSSSPDPVVQGGPVTITVTVSPVAPATAPVTGTVNLVIDGGAPISLPVVNGVATYTSTSLSTGEHTVTASYVGGSGNFAASEAAVPLAGGLTVAARPAGLPPTGSDPAPIGRGAAVSLLAGALLVVVAWRRRGLNRSTTVPT